MGVVSRVLILAICLGVAGAGGAFAAVSADSTADHGKFDELKQPFADGREVTKACLKCHTEAGAHFMKSIHWTWTYEHPITGQTLGKKSLINAFCGNAVTNWGGCTSCHAGYGWADDDFDFSDQTRIDCLVCHDTTGTYYRDPQSPGHPACDRMFADKAPIDLAKVARNVGLPGRANCGSCHFHGGGGDGVKHGDLDSSLIAPARALDVHMDAEGLNFACTECHVTRRHLWAGSRYDVRAVDPEGTGLPGLRRDVATCESCHGDSPHPDNSLRHLKLNGHVDRIACQTCHIPAFARGGVATKTVWDWSTAGRLNEKGEPYKIEDYHQGDGQHRDTYITIKGGFEWGENVVPMYAWFDGVMRYTTADDGIDPSVPVEINHFEGSHDNPRARIWPFKEMRSKQPYDSVNNTLVYTHLWGRDDNAFWGNYDWPKAIAAGMDMAGKPYGGQFDFVETRMYWPITHMVAPKEDALACDQCHAADGRLADLSGFYMPGRDHFGWVDIAGYLALVGAFVGVLLHGLMRVVLKSGRREQ